MPESQQEVLSYIQSNGLGGIRTTVKLLLEKFERKPYGWSYAAVLCTLTHLCARGKVEVRESTNLLDDADLVRSLRNGSAHANLILDPQADFTVDRAHVVVIPLVLALGQILGRETALAIRSDWREGGHLDADWKDVAV